MRPGEHGTANSDYGSGRSLSRWIARWIRLPLPAQLALAGAMLLLPLWTVVVLEMWRNSDVARREAENKVSAMASLGAEVLRAQLQAADLILLSLRDAWRRDRTGFDERVRRRQADAAMHATFEVAVIDAGGRVAYSSALPDAVGTDLSARPLFRAHRAGEATDLRVGEPLWGVLSQRVIIPFSRTIEDQAGRFGGVIVLSFLPTYLAASFETLQLPSGWNIAASHDGGAVMFHAVAVPAADGPGTQLRLDPFAAAGKRDAEPVAAFPGGLTAEGNAIEKSPIDGIDRLYGWRRAGASPLTLAVGQPEATLARAVAASSRPTLIIGLGGSLLLLLALYWLFLMLRARAAQVEQLMSSRAKLRDSQRELRAMNERLQDVREDEYTRIAREIHDELGQRLTVLRMDVSTLPKTVAPQPAALLPAKVEALKSDIDQVIAIVRDISSRLRPAALDAGLGAAIEELSEAMRSTFGITCTVVDRLPALLLSEAVTIAAYRIVQESLTNAVRHSGARRIDITLGVVGDELSIEVHDDGRGFPADASLGPRGLGLVNMRLRASALGGGISINSRGGAGTTLRARLPLRLGAANLPLAEQPSTESGRAPAAE